MLPFEVIKPVLFTNIPYSVDDKLPAILILLCDVISPVILTATLSSLYSSSIELIYYTILPEISIPTSMNPVIAFVDWSPYGPMYKPFE